MADMVRVQINPAAVGITSVAVAIPPVDNLREKTRIVKVNKTHSDGALVPADAVTLLKQHKGKDADGNEVDAVIEYVPPPAPGGAAVTANSGDMTVKDLEAGGKKPSSK